MVGGCLGGPIFPKCKASHAVTELANRLVCLGYRKVKSSPEPIMSSLLTEGTAGSMVPPGLVSACGSPRFLSAFLNASRVRELANGKFI
uniref:Uncharacterized protein n=1 Tax=Cercocebus atys TaxID=9531 RepID=A0A2K5KPJ1_CERAT